MKLVRIRWIDSCTNGGWKHDTDVDDWLSHVPIHAESLGYVVRETDQLLVLVSSVIGHGDDVQYSCLTVVPRVAIETMEEIADG